MLSLKRTRSPASVLLWSTLVVVWITSARNTTAELCNKRTLGRTMTWRSRRCLKIDIFRDKPGDKPVLSLYWVTSPYQVFHTTSNMTVLRESSPSKNRFVNPKNLFFSLLICGMLINPQLRFWSPFNFQRFSADWIYGMDARQIWSTSLWQSN